MAGVSIDLTGMAPLSGIIGGFVGFLVTLSIINIDKETYDLISTGSMTYKVRRRTERQRFIVNSEDKVEM